MTDFTLSIESLEARVIEEQGGTQRALTQMSTELKHNTTTSAKTVAEINSKVCSPRY